VPPRDDLPPGLPPDGQTPWARGPFTQLGEDPASPGTWIWDVDLPLIAPYNWGEWSTLISARDEKILEWELTGVAGVPEHVDNELRTAWLQSIRDQPGGPSRLEEIAADPDALLLRPEGVPERVSFLLIGDPGEGDLSQWALRRPLCEVGGDADFAVILSDVIYPAGEAHHYRDRFHGTLRLLRMPVYAIPGNHDWDDGTLASFVTQFVAGAPEPPREGPVLPEPVLAKVARARERRLWRDPSIDANDAFRRLARLRDQRLAGLPEGPGRYPRQQRAPFFAVEAAGALIIALDQGFDPRNPLDEAQTAWLSALLERHRDEPKILLPGKPVVNRGQRRAPKDEMRLADGSTLEELVRADGNVHRVVAVIGGDVHNYQHYTPRPSPEAQARGNPTPHVIVAGGSGAYMAGTIGTGARLEDELHGAEPVLYPTEAQSRWYLRAQLRARLRVPAVSVGLSSVLALLLAAGASSYAAVAGRGALDALVWGLGLLAVAVVALGAYSGLRSGWPQGVAATVGLAGAVVGTGALLDALLALVVAEGLERHASVLAFAAGLALVVAIFLPFGVLAQAFPLPSQRPGTAIIGAGALTWLLVLAYPGAEGAGWLPDHDAIRMALLVAPTALVALGYASRRVAFWDLVVLGAVAVGLGLLALHLWTGWGDRLTEGAAAALAACIVAAVALQGLGGKLPFAVTALAAAAAGVVVGVLAATGADQLDQQDASAALFLALLLVLATGALAFVAIRQGGPWLAGRDRFVGWVGRPGADPWSMLERSEPPFFKSFLEVTVARGESIEIRCWGVSGFEADADSPILVDTIRIDWPV